MAGLVQVVARWNIFSHHLGTSRWVYAVDDIPDSAVLVDMAEAIETAFSANRSWMSSSSALVDAYAQGVEFVPDPEHVNRFAPVTVQYFAARVDQNGTGDAAGASPQVTYRVTLQTALPGRSHRGRIYLPAVPENKVSAGGAISSDVVTAAETFVASAGEGAATAGSSQSAAWVVPSFKLGTTESVIDVLGRGVVGTQRRRVKATSIP